MCVPPADQGADDLIHRARPLSCRGHASHDRCACADAAAGRVDEVPYSGPHRVARLLLQAALQAALRDDGKAWGAYELHHALVLALDRPDTQAAWALGDDPLAEAAADVERREVMAAGFDEMRHLGQPAPGYRRFGEPALTVRRRPQCSGYPHSFCQTRNLN